MNFREEGKTVIKKWVFVNIEELEHTVCVYTSCICTCCNHQRPSLCLSKEACLQQVAGKGGPSDGI